MMDEWTSSIPHRLPDPFKTGGAEMMLRAEKRRKQEQIAPLAKTQSLSVS